MNPKDAFWLKSTGSAAKPGASHLYCVLTPLCPEGEQLIVNVTSRKPRVPFDMACTLGWGDHPDITEPSYIFFEEARTIYKKLIDIWTFGHQLTMTTPFSDPIFERICAGLLSSDFSTPRIKKYYLEHK